MADIEEFLAGLKKTLNEALNDGASDDEKPTTKAASVEWQMPDEMRKGIDAMTALAKAFTPPDEKGENGGEIGTMLADMKKKLDTHSEVLEKALDRLERVEGVTVVRKSADGDDFAEAGDSKSEGGESKDVKKSASPWGPVVSTLLNGGKVRLVG